jgi:hypothetical protein
MSAAPVDNLADRLTTAADRLATVDRTLATLTVLPGAFAADEAGVPGRIGRELHAHWVALLSARAEEAAETAAHLRDMADSVRTTSRRYTETDEAAARRLARESR